jgi:exopolyphosphatase/guanosine-5'-triphosphate,3'-diphosphate pyrophosphatase
VQETYAACIALGRHNGFEEGHSLQDARLAVRFFDLTRDLHQLGEEYRDLLYCAGLLHDIGYVQGYSGHHKTSYKLILETDLPGLDERQKRIVANVARYHRGARPSLRHRGFAVLEPAEREAVTRLSAVFRFVDGLDRSHTDAVQDLRVRLEGKRLTVFVVCPFGCASEIWAGEKKGRALGDLFGLRVEVRQYSGEDCETPGELPT